MIAIRPLTPADADAYRALRLRGLAEHPDAFTSDHAQEAAKPPGALALRLAPAAEAPHNRVFGAFDGAALVGVVGFEVEPRVKTRHKGHVFGMYVPYEHGNAGIGRALIDAVLAHARGIPGLEKVDLTVTATNAAARALYEHAGFVGWGIERRAIIVAGAPFDKLHMTKTPV
jgi:RimJ/RimL family protein N-acetyltransferase